jgi:mannose/fructose-specific phosphotransferase system component IIA
MSEEGLVRGVLVGHGAMSEGLVNAVQKISGADQDALVAISNDGKSPDALRAELERVLGQGPTIIFADLASGSCALAARIWCRENPDEIAIFGVNLPILLDFVFHRELPLEDLAIRLVEKGRDSIQSTLNGSGHANPPVPR